MSKKHYDITEKILRMRTEKYTLLEKSLAINERANDTTEQDKVNMAFFETLLPTLREVSKEDILLCRSGVSRIIFNYAYKNSNWKSITVCTDRESSVAANTPAPSKRRRINRNDDDDCQIMIRTHTVRTFIPTCPLRPKKNTNPLEESMGVSIVVWVATGIHILRP